MFWILVTAAAALLVNHFWEDILEWASTSLADVVGDLLGPAARDLLFEVLTHMDAVVTAARQGAKKLWAQIKATVLKASVSIEKLTNSDFVRRMTTYIRKWADGEEKYVRVIQEEQISWEDLPEGVRAQTIRHGSVPTADLQLPDTLQH